MSKTPIEEIDKEKVKNDLNLSNSKKQSVEEIVKRIKQDFTELGVYVDNDIEPILDQIPNINTQEYGVQSFEQWFNEIIDELTTHHQEELQRVILLAERHMDTWHTDQFEEELKSLPTNKQDNE